MNDNKSTLRKFTSLRGLLPFLRPYQATVWFALAALGLASGATLSMPIALRFVIDQGIASASVERIDGYFIALFGLAMVLAVFTATRFYLVSWLGERVVADIRQAVFQRLMLLNPTFYESTRRGEILSRLSADTTLILNVVGSSLSIALRSFVTLVGSVILLAVTSPRLSAMIFVIIPLVIFPVLWVGRRVRRLSRLSQDHLAATNALASEALNAVQLVQAFNAEQRESAQYNESVDLAFASAKRRIKTRSALTVFAIVLIFAGIVFVLWMGAQDVIEGTMSAGALGQFLLYAVLVGGSTAGLSEIWGALQQASGASERLLEILHTESDLAAPKDPCSLPTPGTGLIQFDEVSFCYPSRPTVKALDQFSLDVAPNETIALVGPSGAGKTTVFQLLLMFYRPDHGKILLDGTDMQRVWPAQVRSRISIVPQETHLFAGTIFENIRYGEIAANEEAILTAARAAAADEFIEQLPDGYETMLGENGVQLSGGQRQRLAIARALVRNPEILLFDEATNALDLANEGTILRALKNLPGNPTIIIVTHRISTICKADRIVVMDRGRVVGSGGHETLIKNNPCYAKLAAHQFSTA